MVEKRKVESTRGQLLADEYQVRYALFPAIPLSRSKF
jgi:hypothetical protein